MFRDAVEKTMVTNLKIAVIAQERPTMEHVCASLQAWDSSLRIMRHPGGIEQIGRVVEHDNPDVLIVEGIRGGEDELFALERVTAKYNGLAVILLSPNQTPEFLRHGMRVGLRDILPLPVHKDALSDAIGRIQKRMALSVSPQRKGRIMSFIGCKGGSGATFLATNLAYALAQQNKDRVALIDLNRQFGDAALYVSDRAPSSNLAEVTRQIHRLDGSFLSSSTIHVLQNYHVLAAPEEPDQALQIQPEQVEALLWVAVSNYDFVIIDAGRSLDEVTLRAMDQSELIFPVLQQTLPFLRDAKRLLNAFGGLGYGKDKVNLVINRFEKKGAISVPEIEDALGHEISRCIPNSFGAVADSINQGVPILNLAARDPVSKALREMADKLAAVKPERSWLNTFRRAG